MMQQEHKGSWVIILSFLFAITLMAVPLPDWLENWRPSWVALVLIYWCMAVPERVGIGAAWIVGLLLDVQQGATLGVNALGFTVLAYGILQFYQRIRVFPLIQQSILVCFYLLLYELVLLLVIWMIEMPSVDWTYWVPALTSMLFWPCIFIILRKIRRSYFVA